MKHAIERLFFAAALASTMLGCASPAEEQADTSESAFVVSSALTKRLPVPIPVPATDIGKSITSIWEDATIGRGPATFHDNGDCPYETYASTNGAIERERVTCKDGWSRVVLTDGTGPIGYVDDNGDGKVDYVSDARGFSITLDDSDHDGRVDWISEDVRRIEGFVLEGYDPAWTPPSTLGHRVLEDTDLDGMFDQETVTAAPCCGWVRP